MAHIVHVFPGFHQYWAGALKPRIFLRKKPENPVRLEPRPHDYKRFFVLSSAEHEILMLDKSRSLNLLDEVLISRKFHCFCLSNQTFKFDFLYTLKHQWDFKVWAQTQVSTNSSFKSTAPGPLDYESNILSLSKAGPRPWNNDILHVQVDKLSTAQIMFCFSCFVHVYQIPLKWSFRPELNTQRSTTHARSPCLHYTMLPFRLAFASPILLEKK